MSTITTAAVLFNVGCSVAGAIVYAIGQWAWKRSAERRGPYAGRWRGDINLSMGGPEKVDHYAFRNRGEVIEGDIERHLPKDQKHRRWRLYGRVRGRDFFAVFWSTDPAVLSYGCWYLHQVSDFVFEGYYLKLDEGTTGIAVHPIPLKLTKV